MTLSRFAIAPLAFALCLALGACQTASGPSPVQPSPETASATVPASSPPAAPIRGMGVAPRLAGQSHWAIGQCTTNGTVKVCN
ncbi:hypothetical protein KDW40_12745 [Burkholderia cenocepacia]|uniref:hypothetical protein n=1 Tax=Burkholderia cenocepacia TaxID=95486 RepID=UPI001B9DEE99|nr:hypothetical protein [Burkholderia cenocepacia]MBR8040837.1 hypothetical protein [Burkholderia cenocepacia]MBR8074137.1 hypothetical protein [Burkholderia cenocepacia]MBR8326607.1 hypothetical protein [Burkholderia cenocepacia]MBR8443206.1 hypothetical protein [Burkholderia cenocepacia]HDR9799899.1 hypothetical protein [Burkholderia cenocepacia]